MKYSKSTNLILLKKIPITITISGVKEITPKKKFCIIHCCGHKFHKNCLILVCNSDVNRFRCPMCRKPHKIGTNSCENYINNILPANEESLFKSKLCIDFR